MVLLLVCITGLSGCVAAVVAGAAASGLVVYDKRDLQTINADNLLRLKIASKINDDPAFTESHIVVSSFHKMILLAGQTPIPSLRVKAEKIARQLKTYRVYNEITIANPTSKTTRSNDIWLTTKVKAHLLSTEGLRSGNIKVVTENGTVFLMGIVKREQASLAVDAARRVVGVKKIVKVLRYQA